MPSVEESCDLAIAADKYQISRLMLKYMTNICDNLNPKNVWRSLETAVILQKESLKLLCVEVSTYITFFKGVKEGEREREVILAYSN
jgi:hypothetical protein